MSKKQTLQEIQKILGKKIYIHGETALSVITKRKINNIEIISNKKPNEIKNALSKHFQIKTIDDKKTIIKFSKINIIHTTLKTNIKDELKNKTFNVETLLIDLEGRVIDHLGNYTSIKRNILKTLNNPLKTIKNNPIDTIKAFRLTVDYGLKMDKDLKNSIKEFSTKIEPLLDTEQIKNEIRKSNSPFIAGWMQFFGIWKDLTESWTKINSNPIELVVELAIFSNLEEDKLKKYKFSENEIAFIKNFRRLLSKRNFDKKPLEENKYLLYGLLKNYKINYYSLNHSKTLLGAKNYSLENYYE